MPVSDPEKNADRATSASSTAKTTMRGASLKAGYRPDRVLATAV